MDEELAESWHETYGLASSFVVKLYKDKPYVDDLEIKAQDRLNQEVSILGAMQGHANIVQIVAFCQDPLAIVMARYDGDLRRLI